MSRKDKYEWYKIQGICPQCKNPWKGKQVMCDACRSRAEELRRKRRTQRQQTGLCSRCGKNHVIEGTKYCIECAEKAKKHKDSEETKKKRLKKYHMVYKPILQAKRIENKEKGLCADCGLKKPKFGVVCGDCYAKRRKVYERALLRSLGSQCNGDCVNCLLPWCVDTGEDDSFDIKLTAEEKKLSSQLDKEATADEKRWVKDLKRDIRNAKNRYDYALAIIGGIECRREAGETLTAREEKKLLDCEKRMIEAKAFLDTHM